MRELEMEYKRETGLPVKSYRKIEYADERSDGIYGTTYTPEYIEFLESKIAELQKELNTIKDYHNYKEDFENAENEIGQLQDQLSDAENEIRELKYEIKIRPQ